MRGRGRSKCSIQRIRFIGREKWRRTVVPGAGGGECEGMEMDPAGAVCPYVTRAAPSPLAFRASPSVRNGGSIYG